MKKITMNSLRLFNKKIPFTHTKLSYNLNEIVRSPHVSGTVFLLAFLWLYAYLRKEVNKAKIRDEMLTYAHKTLVSVVSIVPILTNTLTVQDLTPVQPEPAKVLSSRSISLQNRYSVESVNEVFKDNILLNIAYLEGKVQSSKDINWNELNKPFEYSLRLDSGETFAYHEEVLPEYQGTVDVTTNAHFNASEGFKTDGYLYGDGVCHFASLLYWAAKDAGLKTNAPTNHDFANIPEIPREYGVSIYNLEGSSVSAYQNLYITNDKEYAIDIKIEYKENKLHISVIEQKVS